QTLSGQPVQQYLGKQAVEDIVKKVKAPRILHLATHGFFLEEQDQSAWRQSAEAVSVVLAQQRDHKSL
ncbi:MAG: hypothetical protein CML07_08160, partial [Psychrobacter sp.]|nr:hypothetical protein [Psychrobacter sp.]